MCVRTLQLPSQKSVDSLEKLGPEMEKDTQSILDSLKKVLVQLKSQQEAIMGQLSSVKKTLEASKVGCVILLQ